MSPRGEQDEERRTRAQSQYRYDGTALEEQPADYGDAVPAAGDMQRRHARLVRGVDRNQLVGYVEGGNGNVREEGGKAVRLRDEKGEEKESFRGIFSQARSPEERAAHWRAIPRR